MALSKDKALDAVKTVLEVQRTQEMPRLSRIREALKTEHAGDPWVPTVQIPEDAPPLMKEIARKSRTNYLPLLVKTFSQVMKLDGCAFSSDEGGTDPWVWWQRNRMDSRQTGLTRSVLSYGAGYATVLSGTYGRGLKGPSVSLFSPRDMTAVYADPESDEWPILAVSVDERASGTIVTLYDEEQMYRFGVEGKPGPRSSWPSFSVPYLSGRLTYIDALSHGTGAAPVVRYRDRNLLAGEEQFGIVEPLMTVQERLDETTFQMLATQYVQLFKQRYVIGWVPKTEREQLKAGAARIWYIDEDPADVKVEELPGGTVQPYIDSRNSALRDFSAIGQVPVQTFGIDGLSNISDATLAGLEAAKNREGDEIKTSLGESHEQMLRLCAQIDGNETAADDYEAEVRWRNFEARSYSQTVDGITKLGQMLGIPTEDLLEDIPGMTGTRQERIADSLRRTKARETVAALTKPAVTIAPAADGPVGS